ncbi:MAG TPA: hypothetical protein VG734_26990 [Lacunisphaera sp.]|nr:hypothetical protein [Lacunisphaera sp.]
MSDPVSLHSEYRDDCLVISVRGRDIFERVNVTLESIAATIRSRPVCATLIDIRLVPGPISFLERFQLGEAAARLLPRLPLGILMREDQADPRRIGQLAASNRGYTVEVFTVPDAAEAWLKHFHALPGTAP